MTITVTFLSDADFIRAHAALHAKDNVQTPVVGTCRFITQPIPVGTVDVMPYAKNGSFEFESEEEYDKARVMWDGIPFSTSYLDFL